MDGDELNDGEWQEALRLRDSEGDVSLLESMIVECVPLAFQEAVRREIRRGLKQPGDASKRLADAVEWFRQHEAETEREELLRQTSQRFKLKADNNCRLLWLAVQGKRTDVNAELRRRGTK